MCQFSAIFVAQQQDERCVWKSNLSKTKMTSAAVDDVTERLAQTKVAPQNELSFKGRGWKLDKAEDGECAGIKRTESHMQSKF